MNFTEIYRKIRLLPYDHILGLSYVDSQELYSELKRYHDWELIKSPPHPAFKPKYQDLLLGSYSQKTFDFKVFLQYMMHPWLEANQNRLIITETEVGYIIQKKYIGCEHEFVTDRYVCEEFPEQKLIPDRTYCIKCGYQQVLGTGLIDNK